MLQTSTADTAPPARRFSFTTASAQLHLAAGQTRSAAAVDGEIMLKSGESVRYRMLGQRGAPLHVLLGGISADRCVDVWWRDLLGDQASIDLQHSAVMSIDWLQHPRSGHDCISTADQADALAAVLDALEHQQINVLIGASYGAMVGLAFAARHPHRIRHLLAISGAHRASASATACRLLQREIIRLARKCGEETCGLLLARALALTSYRPPAMFDQRFAAATPAQQQSGLLTYFQHQGDKLARQFEGERYLSLSSSLDQHLVNPCHIQCRVDLIGVSSDTLVPLAQLRELAASMKPHARLHVLNSDYGHDAFLKSTRQLNILLSRLLAARPSAGSSIAAEVPHVL